MSIEFEPFEAHARENPYPVYRRLRDEAPVHFAPGSNAWCVSRHEDVTSVLRSPDVFSSRAMGEVLMNADLTPSRPRHFAALIRFLWKTRVNPEAMRKAGNLVSIDPPRHDAMRAIVNRGFSPRRVEAWRPRVQELAAQHTAGLGDGGGAPRADYDVVRDLAVPLPVTIIAEMLGVERERQPDFKRWSDTIVSVASGTSRENPLDQGLLDVFGELYCYLRDLVRERRRAPQDDLISVLVDPAQEGVLDEVDVVQFVVLLLVAGNETTTNLIGNAVTALLDHPEQLARVAADPSLVPGLVEETLRYDAPIQLVMRTATRDVEIAGTRIPAGGVVAALLGSANRDERRFPDADVFDVTRDARGHVSFGFGVHFCLGASLARLEATEALLALVPLLPKLRRGPSPSPLLESFLIRGRQRLELVAA